MKFRKKPVVIEAVQWTGTNFFELLAMGLTDAYWRDDHQLEIMTLEGGMVATKGDWIIKGVKGEFYPIKEEIFRETYEQVD
jgi:hypothetical protein